MYVGKYVCMWIALPLVEISNKRMNPLLLIIVEHWCLCSLESRSQRCRTRRHLWRRRDRNRGIKGGRQAHADRGLGAADRRDCEMPAPEHSTQKWRRHLGALRCSPSHVIYLTPVSPTRLEMEMYYYRLETCKEL